MVDYFFKRFNSFIPATKKAILNPQLLRFFECKKSATTVFFALDRKLANFENLWLFVWISKMLNLFQPFFLGPLSIIVDFLLTQLSHNNCYYYDVYFIFNIILSTVQRLAPKLCLSRMPHFKIILLIDGLLVKISAMFFWTRKYHKNL